jgi:hypothetical protein
MMRRSSDERLRTAADCLSRLRSLSLVPKPVLCERHNIGGKNLNPLFKKGPGPGLEPVGGEFQPRLEIGYPGFGAYLIFALKARSDRGSLKITNLFFCEP